MMEDLNGNGQRGNGYSVYLPPSPTLRDVLAIAFRHRWVMALSFIGILSGSILIAALEPNRYDATMKILVKRDRVDPVVTPEASVTPQSTPVTEEELNSEVELIRSHELLERVVLACNLAKPRHYVSFVVLNDIPTEFSRSREEQFVLAADRLSPPRRSTIPTEPAWPAVQVGASTHALVRAPDQDARIGAAILALDKKLRVDVVKKTNLIAVGYEGRDPQLAARVLTTLASLYLEKHVAVHRPPGAYDFFQQETQRYRQRLTEDETRLIDFNQRAEVTSPLLEKETTLQKLADFQVTLRETQTAVAETQQRIRTLQAEAASTPIRVVTQVRNTDDGALLSQIRSNLLALEQKRTELLGKFEHGYRSVQEVEAEIAQARAALASAEKSQIHEETTDRDLTRQWITEELAKARTDLAGLQARAQATALTVQMYRDTAHSLEQKEIVQADLVRNIKAAEESYLLSMRKEEEARISDALDRGRILNVTIAEAPTPPLLPANHRFRIGLLGFLLAALTSVLLAFAAERLDSTFRTPDELRSILDLPVLAAIPQPAKNGVRSYVS